MVWYTARRLEAALAGRGLTRSDFRVPRLATANLTGDVVTETASRGKHLLTRTRGGLTVHTHLRMDGAWRVRPAAEPVKDSHRIRLVLANDDWQIQLRLSRSLSARAGRYRFRWPRLCAPRISW